MYVLTAKEMQSIDHYTIQNLGISQEILMEKAALCAVEEIMKLYPHNVICVCGNGNNGGDGIAVARILKMKGIRAAVYLCSDKTLCKPSVQKQLLPALFRARLQEWYRASAVPLTSSE